MRFLDPHRRTLQEPDSHRPGRERGHLQRLHGLREDLRWPLEPAVYHGGGAHPRQHLQHRADPQRGLQTFGPDLDS